MFVIKFDEQFTLRDFCLNFILYEYEIKFYNLTYLITSN